LKIKNIKINSYGNLNDKEMDLSDNINIIYGKNEAGKSTLLKFITNIFYGTSRNKKGREYSDYEKYKPWGKEDFSGRIKYELDNGEEFEVYRDFAKKNPKIYNSNLEDISKNYPIDKSLGSQFFYEQTKVDEQTFLSTIAAMQQEVKLERNSQNVLIQKMANIAGTGEDSVSYNKALDKLYKKQLDEIGTYRSQGKPINIVQNKINELKNKKMNLLSYKDKKFDFEENKSNIDEQIRNDELKISLLKNLKNINDQEKNDTDKLNYNITLIDQRESDIEKLNNEKNEILKSGNYNSEQELIEEIRKNENNLERLRMSSYTEDARVRTRRKNTKKINTKKYIILLILAVIINIMLFIFIPNIYAKFIGLILFPIIIALFFVEKNKTKENENKNQNKNEMSNKAEESEILTALDNSKRLLNEINSKNAQIEVLERTRNTEISKVEEIKNKIKNFKEEEIEKIRNSYNGKINDDDLEKYLCSSNVDYELENLQEAANERKLELHRIDLSQENIMPQLDDLAKVEEQLSVAEEEYEELMKKNNAMEIVRQALESAYEKMKNTVTPKFTNSLSNNINKISCGKYAKVSINDENGLMVELPNGEYVPAEKLSLGTIDQLYLSLRLSMCEEVSEENMPLILDEAFAFYDDERLENILRFLIENYYNKQIIILTCTNREEEILNKMKYEYSKITL
jgi:DNA repair exonuclease SbcCD ATPase subunit